MRRSRQSVMAGRWIAVSAVTIVGLLATGMWCVGFWPFVSSPDLMSAEMHHLICDRYVDSVKLTQIARFDWDRVVILTPYADRQMAEHGLGFSWPGYSWHENALESEGYDVLIFVKGKEIARVIDHPRNNGDFSDNLSGKSLTRNDASFAIRRRGSDCWATLDLQTTR